MKNKTAFKSGYIAVAGFPNVGKSTLMNRIIGSKLSIVSPKPQTTRGIMRGIMTTDAAQMIFLDTAGIHKPHDKLGEYMVDTAMTSFQDVDIIYMMVEGQSPRKGDRELIEKVAEAGKTTFLLINKIDALEKEKLLPVIDRYRSIMDFDEIIPVSAKDGENVDRLLELTVAGLPVGPPYFPEDIVSDQIERDFITEFIREKIFLNTRDEVPYSTAVVIDDMTEREGGGAYIQATIYLEKDSQKGIVIGKGGKMLKKIGADARREIEQFLGFKVYLELFVKIEKKWRSNAKSLRKVGYK